MDRESAWKRFSGRHLGKWRGRSTHVDVRTMEQIRLDDYSWEVGDPTRSETETRVVGTMSGNGWEWEAGYRVGSPAFYAFEDGSYCAEHDMLEVDGVVSRIVVEMCLTISVTERLRVLLLYDFESILRRAVLLNEVRDGLWEERNPSSLFSLIGKWQGQTTSARLPSLGAGIISYNSETVFLWQASDNKVRESLSASSPDGEVIDKITTYGRVEDDGDLTAIDWEGPEHRRTMLLNCASYVSAPMTIPPGNPWWCEFAVFVTPRCRRRLKRLYDKGGSSVSHSLMTENSVA